MIPEPLTPLQESAARTGRRYFRAPVSVYAALCEQIDARRGFPAGVGTEAVTKRAFPRPSRATKAEDGDILISVETWRFTTEDGEMVAQAIEGGLLAELTDEEYSEVSPKPKPLP